MSVDWKEVVASGTWKKNFDGEMEFHLPVEFHEEVKGLPYQEMRLFIIGTDVSTNRWEVRGGRLITGLRELSIDKEAEMVLESGGTYTFNNGWVMVVA